MRFDAGLHNKELKSSGTDEDPGGDDTELSEDEQRAIDNATQAAILRKTMEVARGRSYN